MLYLLLWLIIEKEIIYLKLGLARKLNLLGIPLHKNDIYLIEANKRTVKDYEVWGFIISLGLGFDDLFADIDNKLEIDDWYFMKYIVIFIYGFIRKGDENRRFSWKSQGWW